MNKEYKTLFITIAEGAAYLAEGVMEVEAKQGQSSNAAQTMKNSFNELRDKLRNNEELSSKNIADLYLGATIVASNFDNQIKRIRTAQSMYRDKLIPKLRECIKKPREEQITFFEEIFSSIN